VRSAGSNGLFDSPSYVRGDISSLREDLVVANDSFVRRPPPELLDLRSRQLRAQREIEWMSTAMLSWVTDQVSLTSRSAGDPSDPVDLGLFPPISVEDLRNLLIVNCSFYYVTHVPVQDPWGNPYDYFLDVEDVLHTEVVAVRSLGRDGLAEGSVYLPGVFPASDLDRDTVIADGLDVRVPDDLASLLHLEDFESGDFRHWSAAVP
jgi:hypothetical protein